MGNQNKKPRRIGIYAGAFDPVHAGHVAFALQALLESNLDRIIFMPERRPRHKPSVEHYAHRIAMLRTALAPHPKLAVMEVVDKQFTVKRTLPHLHKIFPGARLTLLMGSDTALALPTWPHVAQLMQVCELTVGLRDAHQKAAVIESITAWNPKLENVTLINSFASDVSSTKVRHALRTNRHTKGLLASVRRYARQEWLYVSPAYHTATTA